MKKKKAAAAAAAVSVLALSVVTNLSFTSEELLHSAAYLDSHTQYAEAGETGEYEISYTEAGQLSKVDSVRAWFIRLPVAVKAVFLLPLWGLGAIPAAVGTAALSALAPFWSQIVSFLLQAGILIGVFAAAYKLLFPNKKLRDLFKKKNFKWLFLGAATVTGANLVLTEAWAGWPVVRVVLMVGVGFGVLYLLWRRLCGKFKAPEPEPVKTRLVLEY